MSFIFPQGRWRMEIYRLVNELDLYWIFNCINRGKINNMVGGSVTHTQTTLKVNKQERCYMPGAKVEVRARVRCASLTISMLSYG